MSPMCIAHIPANITCKSVFNDRSLAEMFKISVAGIFPNLHDRVHKLLLSCPFLVKSHNESPLVSGSLKPLKLGWMKIGFRFSTFHLGIQSLLRSQLLQAEPSQWRDEELQELLTSLVSRPMLLLARLQCRI
jgi:hypothetical protein